MKRCVLRWLLLLLAAGSLQAEQAPPTPASDAIFLWLAGGISSARIQRLIQTQNAQTQNAKRRTKPELFLPRHVAMHPAMHPRPAKGRG